MWRLVIVLLVLALGVRLALWQGSRHWNASTSQAEARLRSSATLAPLEAYSEAELVGLPEPVARYFRAALRDGQPIVRRARILWDGEFNTGKPGMKDAWKPLTATQEFVPGAPGFVWDARVAMAPGVPMRVRDSFVDGTGGMYGALWGLIKIVDVRGTPTIASGALQRYLGEASWLPTALLPRQGVTWTPIDDSSARATIHAGTTSVYLDFRFGADGLIASVFAPDRYYDDGKNPPSPRPWLAHNLRYMESHGMRVPAEAVVEWHLPTGTFQYWRGRPRAIEYEFAK